MNTTPCHRLVVFSSVEHHLADKRLRAHGGFVREIDIWARIFPEVLVVAPVTQNPPLADTISYSEENITVASLGEVRYTNGVIGKLRLAALMPERIRLANRLIEPTDVIMARGPEAIGFLGVLITLLRRNLPHFARYVDQWDNYHNERPQYRLQKWIYKHMFGGPVMIYGTYSSSLPHLVPFFTSSITVTEWTDAGDMITQRNWDEPFRLLFVGRFLRFKGVDVLLRAIREIIDGSHNITLDIVGDGPERDNLVNLTRELSLSSWVRFQPWVGKQRLNEFYAGSNCLVHPSRKEGYGKVILEAMTFGLPVVGSDVGVSRTILNPPECGYLAEPDNVQSLTEAIRSILVDPVLARQMGKQGRQRARRWLLEELETQYRSFVRDHLGWTGTG